MLENAISDLEGIVSQIVDALCRIHTLLVRYFLNIFKWTVHLLLKVSMALGNNIYIIMLDVPIL